MQKHRDRVVGWRSALALAGGLAALAGSSCAGPSGWPEPVEEGAAEAPNIATSQEAITTPVQGVYVVTSEGSDGYCDAVLFAGNEGAAIQSCIDRANADGGGLVLVRGGLYTTGTWPLNMKSNVTLRGDGYSGATFSPAAAQVFASVADDSTIENLTFGVATLTEGVIRLGAPNSGRYRIRVENNRFVQVDGNSVIRYGVYLNSGTNTFHDIVIRNNNFLSSSPGSFNPVDLDGSIWQVRVEDNTMDLSGGGNIRLWNSSATLAHGIVVSGNMMKRASESGWGIIVGGAKDAQVRGNSIINYFTPLSITGLSGCGASVTGNLFGAQEPSVHANCAAQTVFAGNSGNNLDGPGGTKVGKAGVLVRAHRNGTQTFTPGTGTAIVFNTEAVDYGSNYSVATGTFTAPVAGYYHVHACARVQVTNFAATDILNLSIQVSGAAVEAALNRSGTTGSGDSFTSCVDDIVSLTSGGTFQVRADATGSGTRTIVGTNVYSTFLHVRQISD
jgi:hypothetical protein